MIISAGTSAVLSSRCLSAEKEPVDLPKMNAHLLLLDALLDASDHRIIMLSRL